MTAYYGKLRNLNFRTINLMSVNGQCNLNLVHPARGSVKSRLAFGNKLACEIVGEPRRGYRLLQGPINVIPTDTLWPHCGPIAIGRIGRQDYPDRALGTQANRVFQVV